MTYVRPISMAHCLIYVLHTLKAMVPTSSRSVDLCQFFSLCTIMLLIEMSRKSGTMLWISCRSLDRTLQRIRTLLPMVWENWHKALNRPEWTLCTFGNTISSLWRGQELPSVLSDAVFCQIPWMLTSVWMCSLHSKSKEQADLQAYSSTK